MKIGGVVTLLVERRTNQTNQPTNPKAGKTLSFFLISSHSFLGPQEENPTGKKGEKGKLCIFNAHLSMQASPLTGNRGRINPISGYAIPNDRRWLNQVYSSICYFIIKKECW